MSAADGVSYDTDTWRAFAALTDRIDAGEAVDRAELEALAEQPEMVFWRECNAPNSPDARKIGNWLAATFWQELGLEQPVKHNVNRRNMVRTYRYNFEHRREIETLLAEMEADSGRFLDLAEKWLDADHIPHPIRVLFLPALPELLYRHGRLVVDTGVLHAGGVKQLERQLVSLLYRNLQAIPGPHPLELGGIPSIVHTFRILFNEGLADWIDDSPHTYFRTDHYKLSKVVFIPEEYFRTADRSLRMMNNRLARFLDDPDGMDARQEKFASVAAATGTLEHVGYSMVATIAARLGEERLLAVKGSVPDFLAAYQEAALQNPEPRPYAGQSGHEPWESMAPLDPDLFARVHALLVEYFPPAGE